MVTYPKVSKNLKAPKTHAQNLLEVVQLFQCSLKQLSSIPSFSYPFPIQSCFCFTPDCVPCTWLFLCMPPLLNYLMIWYSYWTLGSFQEPDLVLSYSLTLLWTCSAWVPDPIRQHLGHPHSLTKERMVGIYTVAEPELMNKFPNVYLVLS